MKELQSLNVARLTNLEFGQHVKSVKKGITALNTATDTGFTTYLTQLETNIGNYDKAMVQVQKSDETEKIAIADQVRDTAFSAMSRYVKVFELSENEAEVLAYKSIDTLLMTNNGIQNSIFEEVSNAMNGQTQRGKNLRENKMCLISVSWNTREQFGR